MGVLSFIGKIFDGAFGMFFKFLFLMIAFMLILALVIVLTVNWPFTIMLLIGILLSSIFYTHLDKRFNLQLPDYFKVSIEDFLATFNEGEEEVQNIRTQMNDALKQARAEAEDMHNALVSIEEQYKELKTKKSLKNLFTKSPEEISPRMAKAIEMELGKPKWAQHIDKVSESENGSWNGYKF